MQYVLPTTPSQSSDVLGLISPVQDPAKHMEAVGVLAADVEYAETKYRRMNNFELFFGHLDRISNHGAFKTGSVLTVTGTMSEICFMSSLRRLVDQHPLLRSPFDDKAMDDDMCHIINIDPDVCPLPASYATVPLQTPSSASKSQKIQEHVALVNSRANGEIHRGLYKCPYRWEAVLYASPEAEVFSIVFIASHAIVDGKAVMWLGYDLLAEAGRISQDMPPKAHVKPPRLSDHGVSNFKSTGAPAIPHGLKVEVDSGTFAVAKPSKIPWTENDRKVMLEYLQAGGVQADYYAHRSSHRAHIVKTFSVQDTEKIRRVSRDHGLTVNSALWAGLGLAYGIERTKLGSGEETMIMPTPIDLRKYCDPPVAGRELGSNVVVTDKIFVNVSNSAESMLSDLCTRFWSVGESYQQQLREQLSHVGDLFDTETSSGFATEMCKAWRSAPVPDNDERSDSLNRFAIDAMITNVGLMTNLTTEAHEVHQNYFYTNQSSLMMDRALHASTTNGMLSISFGYSSEQAESNQKLWNDFLSVIASVFEL